MFPLSSLSNAHLWSSIKKSLKQFKLRNKNKRKAATSPKSPFLPWQSYITEKKQNKTSNHPPNTHIEEKHSGLLPICLIQTEKTLGLEVESNRLQNITPCLSCVWYPYDSTHLTSIDKLHKKIMQQNSPVAENTSRESFTED